MDEFESDNFKKLTKKEFDDIKRKQSKMLREQPFHIQSKDPPKLTLDELFPNNEKLIPKSRKLIMEALKEAGVDISTAVTIQPKSYEEAFISVPKPIQMLKRHSRFHEMDNNVQQNDRIRFRQENLLKVNEARRKRRFRFDVQVPHTPSSTLSGLERDNWNMDQKKAQIFNNESEFMKLYSDKSITTTESNINDFESVDLFPSEEEDFPCYNTVNLIEEENSYALSPNKEVKKIASNDDFTSTQDLVNLCSGKFDTQNQYSLTTQSRPISPKHKIGPKNMDFKLKENKISISDKPSKFKMENFIDDEAEQSGSDVSLGSEHSDSDEGSLPEFLCAEEDTELIMENDVRQAHFDDILRQDNLEIEALKDFHMPKSLNVLSQHTEPLDSEDETIIFNNIQSNNVEYSQESGSSGEDNSESVFIKIRSHLSKMQNLKKTVAEGSELNEDAILPDYAFEDKSILTMIKENIPKSVSTFGSTLFQDKHPTFANIFQSKKISSFEPLTSSFHNSNSACIFISNDSISKNVDLHNADSNNDSKHPFSSNINSNEIPPESIFSLLKSSKY